LEKQVCITQSCYHYAKPELAEIIGLFGRGAKKACLMAIMLFFLLPLSKQITAIDYVLPPTLDNEIK
jgi:hypothetical protein